mmetsp:Transcript_20526/g.43007  ORF Transcript_20526/g.43007 Transcript_20526/m.43007 type:complete len:410 (-) Transcript_20526:30-1259(-)
MILYHLFPIILGLTTQTVSAERSQLLSQVNVLTGSTFDAIMKSSEDAVPVWLLDFYAPWCGHCKELAPVLESIVADKENDFIAIGTIDAPANRKLAEKFDVQGFPTLYWRYNGEDFLHTGSRSRESLMSYGRRLTGDAIVDVKDMTHFADDPVVYIFDGAEGEVGAKVAMKYKMDALFGRTPGSETAKKLCRVERGEEPLCEVFEEKWDDFVRKSNLPTLSEINGDTYSKVTSVGLPLVVAAITPDNVEAANSIKSIAREMRSKGKYVFSTVDRVTFREWLKGFEKLKEGEDQHFIFDNDKKVYWVQEEGKSLKEFVRDVSEGKAEQFTYSRKKKGGLEGIFQLWKDYLPWSCAVFIPFLLIIWVVVFDEDPGMGEPEQDTAVGQDKEEQETPQETANPSTEVETKKDQ